MSSVQRLGLGSAQWGLHYGLNNLSGKPSRAELARLLGCAKDHGIDLIDTANAYGSAEAVIGSIACSKSFRVVTKTIPLPSAAKPAEIKAGTRKGIERSLSHLKRENLSVVLVHHGDRLLDDGDPQWEALVEAKRRGLVERIGVSVYEPSRLGAIIENFPIEVVQLPYNIYDQRFARTGLLDRLAASNIEIHARSPFLQGLLLMAPAALPQHFRRISDHHARLHASLERSGVDAVSAALHFSLDNARIGHVIAGVESLDQYGQLAQAAASNRADRLSLDAFSIEDEEIILPKNWPLPVRP